MRIGFYIPVFILLLSGCGNSAQEVPEEDWIKNPITSWPDIVYTNRIEFKDSIYENLANAFLVNTGYDTLAVTCKHIFLVFRKEKITTINPGEQFISWQIHPKLNDSNTISLTRLLNRDSSEEVGAFNTLKTRDWLVFKISGITKSTQVPLKVRTVPVEKGELLYTIGWATRQNTELPTLIKLQVFKDMGPYFYFNTLTLNTDPAGRSGSPVIDQKGHLVGLISGAEGRLGVAAGISSLQTILDNLGIKYISAAGMSNPVTGE